MPPDAAFRLSTYLTLSLACACLGYAEATLFPEIGLFAIAAVVALAVIYRAGPRVERLSLGSANVVGGGIVLLCAGWAAVRVVKDARESEYSAVGWQLLALPLFGPVLLSAIPAKLLRREKHPRDWWAVHGIGLVAVALAGALGDRPGVFVLMAMYAVCGVWSLAEFGRVRHLAAAVPGPTPVTPQSLAVGRPHRGFGRGLLRVVAAASLAVPLFLLTPRSTQTRSEFGNNQVEIGYAANQMIDLRRTGRLEANPGVAFEVFALHPDGRPKTDLKPAQRWRGATLSQYNQGSWRPFRYELPTATGLDRSTEPWSPPDLGPSTYRLTYDVPSGERSYFLADPVAWAPGQPAAVASVCAGGLRGWNRLPDGSGNYLRTACAGDGTRVGRYVQVTCTGPEPDLGPGFELATRPASRIGHAQSPQATLQPLLANYPDRVREYADRVLGELVRTGRLAPAVLHPGGPAHDEAVARALSRHLSEDPAFRYTTNLERIHPEADPIEEFLFDLKAGHCERFAAALVMLLRSRGIPAVVVLGFRGCEHLGGGRYVIRQEHAHAWVEALISRPGPTGANPGEPAAEWHWLSLDPTPNRDPDTTAGVSAADLWTGGTRWIKAAFANYVMNYTPARRERAMRAAAGLATDPLVLAGVAGAIGLVVGVRWIRRRPPREGAPPDPGPTQWFARLLAVLAEHGFTPQPGDTPREFAAAVGEVLARRPTTATLAAVPEDWANAYYESRFGGVAIALDQQTDLEARLDLLARALKE